MTDELPKIKNPTTYDQQIDIFRKRGLVISSEDRAICILKQVSYYRLSAYTLTLKKDNVFFSGVTIDRVYALYEFDRKLRSLIMGALESIEIAFRTEIAYLLAHKYGTMGYLNPSNFSNNDFHTKFIEHLNDELDRAHEIFIKHQKEKYGGQFPIWVATEVMSFGDLSKLFNNMKNEDKQKLSKEHYGIPHYYISSWLRLVTIVRNICAHYGRLYNRKINVYPRLDTTSASLGIDTTRIFAAIFIMKKLYTDRATWNNFVINLKALLDEYEVVNLDYIGFPKDWYEILYK